MRNVLPAATIIVLIGISPALARGGMHGGSFMHGGSLMQGGGLIHGGSLMAPANPSVPPSLTPDARLIGTAPLPAEHEPTKAAVSSLSSQQFKLDPEDAAVDKKIKNICRGC